MHRKVPKTTAGVLLSMRLTGVARKWLESVPPERDFEETIRRFQLSTYTWSHNEMLNEFWHRRQGQECRTSLSSHIYIEEMETWPAA